MEENCDGHLNDGNDCSKYRSPQPYEEKYPGPCSEQMQNAMGRLRSFTEVADSTLKESDTDKKPLEKQPSAGPAVSERRE